MFDVGGGELLLIVLAILLLFGPKKLPEVAQTIGKGMRKVKQAQTQFQNQMNEIQREIEKEDLPAKGENKIPAEKPENNQHKIGAFDQLDLDQNFVTGYVREDEQNLESGDEQNTNTEKVNTSKNNTQIDD